jgi:putative FmdB family regulatory protein
MPIYPYVCTACGHEFDALQKISDEPLTECPSCGESTLRKRLAAPAFQLKGTGWYETDFKNSGKAKQSSGGKSDGEGKAADKKDTGGEAKSNAKTDSGGASSSSDSGKSKAAGKEN